MLRCILLMLSYHSIIAIYALRIIIAMFYVLLINLSLLTYYSSGPTVVFNYNVYKDKEG